MSDNEINMLCYPAYDFSKLQSNVNTYSEARKQNIEIYKVIQLNSHEVVKLKGNDEFYEDESICDKFINIILDKNLNEEKYVPISIRLIDYFVTKYSKYNKSCFKIKENNKDTKDAKDTIFNVHFDYKNQLKKYSKTYFDPFSRGDRIPFFMKDTCIITTIGQLNFFRWFLSKRIYEYLIDIKELVYEDMNKKNKKKEKKMKKLNKTPKKEKYNYEMIKKPQIINNTDNVNKQAIKILVSF
jgi:hypothetical protein